MVNYDIAMLIIAFALGYYLDSYESKYTCPDYCKIEHKHRFKEKE